MQEDGRGAEGDAWERVALQALLRADLRERRATRRWRLFRTLTWAVVILAAIGAFLIQRSPQSARGEQHTAVVHLLGEISEESAAAAAPIIEAMRRALEDPRTSGLILRINSPGGSPVQAGQIRDEIVRLRAVHGKAIHAVVEDSAASAAYYVASGADQIHVDKASVVGSIGVLIDGFGFVDTMQRLGVERRLLIAGENKGFLDPFSPLPEAQREHAQRMLEQVHQQFIAAVRKGRGERLHESADLFSGLFWTGQTAVELGLADDFGTVDSVARDVIGAERTVDYTVRRSLIERLSRRVGAALAGGAWDALVPPAALR